MPFQLRSENLKKNIDDVESSFSFSQGQNKLHHLLCVSPSLPRGALPPHRDPKERPGVAARLREEDGVARLRLPAHLSPGLQSPGEQEGGVHELRELDR